MDYAVLVAAAFGRTMIIMSAPARLADRIRWQGTLAAIVLSSDGERWTQHSPMGAERRPLGHRGSVRVFLLTAGMILAISGAAKVYSVFGSGKILEIADPVFGLKFKTLFLAVGLGEILVAILCLFDKHSKVALPIVASLATGFLMYRVGLWGMHWNHPCDCLGTLTETLYLSPEIADSLMKVMLGYLIMGSYLLSCCQSKKRSSKLAS